MRPCRKDTCLASGFLKKKGEEGLFIVFKMAIILFKIKKIHCFFYSSNSHKKIKHAGQDIVQNITFIIKKGNEEDPFFMTALHMFQVFS